MSPTLKNSGARLRHPIDLCSFLFERSAYKVSRKIDSRPQSVPKNTKNASVFLHYHIFRETCTHLHREQDISVSISEVIFRKRNVLVEVCCRLSLVSDQKQPQSTPSKIQPTSNYIPRRPEPKAQVRMLEAQDRHAVSCKMHNRTSTFCTIIS